MKNFGKEKNIIDKVIEIKNIILIDIISKRLGEDIARKISEKVYYIGEYVPVTSHTTPSVPQQRLNSYQKFINSLNW